MIGWGRMAGAIGIAAVTLVGPTAYGHPLECPWEAPAEWGLSKPATLDAVAVLSQPTDHAIDEKAPPSLVPEAWFRAWRRLAQCLADGRRAGMGAFRRSSVSWVPARSAVEGRWAQTVRADGASLFAQGRCCSGGGSDDGLRLSHAINHRKVGEVSPAYAVYRSDSRPG
jgi:hypothetical protein